jgi:F0F1-type ATP synthase epsilon subunit
MKIKKHYSLLFILLLILSSCSDDKDFVSVIPEVDTITIWVGQEDSVRITSESGSLSVQSDDEQIATAYIKDNLLIINAKEKSSSTIIRIKEGSIEKAQIKVYVQTLFGAWKEAETSHYKCEAIVNAEDGTVKEKIRQDLWEYAAKQLQTIYGFNAITQNLEIITTDNKRINGRFEYRNGDLILNYDNKSELYKVSPLGLHFIQLTQDFTEDLKKQYPNAGIHNALVNRYLLYISL